MQRTFNNEITFIEKSFNEICYEFISFQSTNLIQTFFKSNFLFIAKTIRLTIANSIVMTQMTAESLYDIKHQRIKLKVEN